MQPTKKPDEQLVSGLSGDAAERGEQQWISGLRNQGSNLHGNGENATSYSVHFSALFPDLTRRS